MSCTKGEWKIKPCDHIGCTYVSFGDFKGGIEIWHHHGDSGEKEEADCNAKLIAAAPELLEALRAVLGYEKRCSEKGSPKIGNGILSIIHKAIKKATE